MLAKSSDNKYYLTFYMVTGTKIIEDMQSQLISIHPLQVILCVLVPHRFLAKQWHDVDYLEVQHYNQQPEDLVLIQSATGL